MARKIDTGPVVKGRPINRPANRTNANTAIDRGTRRLNRSHISNGGGDDYARDLGLINGDGTENPALVVFRKEGDQVRLFWASEIGFDMADPGQDPRDAPDIASLWSILDLTPEGRGSDWYPKLSY